MEVVMQDKYIDLAFAATAKQPVCLPAGQAKVRIIKATLGESNAGAPMITVYLKSAEKANVQLMKTWIVYPIDGDDEDERNRKALQAQDFCGCFGIPSGEKTAVSEVDSSIPTWVGKEGWVVLGYTEDEVYGPQNNVKRCLVPQVR
jgi:hypothetical protein